MAQTIKKFGIVGAGQMGNGIAQVCSLAGIPVVIHDVSADRMKSALATINGNMAREVSRQRLTEEDKAAALKRISTTDTLDGLPTATSSSRPRPRRKRSSARSSPSFARR